MSKVFVNEEINNAGLYAFNVYVRGIPKVVIVDDNAPYDSVSRIPLFARFGEDGSMWPALLEKAYAKVHGNYERIKGGWHTEAVQFLTNAATNRFETKNLNAATLWSLASEADKNGFIMGGNTPSNPDGDKAHCMFDLIC